MRDAALQRQFINDGEAPANQKRIEHQKLDALLGFCETHECRRGVLLRYFGEGLDGPCNNCDTCLSPPKMYDGTVEAQKLMSCVYRTGQMFGAAHVIDVLMGGDTERIRKFGHKDLSTYGIGGGTTRRQWQSVVRQLVAAGLLEVDVAGHGGIRLGPGAAEVLRGERSVSLRKDAVKETAKKKGGSGKARKRSAATFSLAPQRAELFDALRARRLELARKQNVPPYVIFHDATLLAMCESMPGSLDELGRVHGVGEAKLKKYGEKFLEVIGGWKNV